MENTRLLIKNLHDKVSHKVTVKGWIKNIRKHSQVYFLDIYDHSQVIQCVISQDTKHKLVRGSCVQVDGHVNKRAHDQINSELFNGHLEITITKLTIFSVPKVFISSGASEEVQLQHRPIYLHELTLRKSIDMRSKLLYYLRQWAVGNTFQEVQTPILTAATMEGARDFLIPSRLHSGKFYALPQAPQIFKQLLMIGGIERYFQIAPCFRDEDARNDRCYGEFYQLDMEMAFCNMDEIINIIKDFVKAISSFAQLPYDFQIMDYNKAIDLYGTDKPDLRFDLYMEDFTDFFKNSQFKIFTSQIQQGAIVKAVKYHKCPSPNKILTETEKLGFKIAYVTKKDGKLTGPISKFCTELQLKEQETIFFICHKNACQLGGELINILKELRPQAHNKMHFLFIQNMPMFEKDKNNNWTFTHNPFSKPQNPQHDPQDIIGFQYDLVCNGFEIASGGLRNEDYSSLINMFSIVGYNEEQVLSNFAIAKALRDYAPPPHGGFAIGIDRLLMILLNTSSIRQVCAFPLSSSGICYLMNAPTKVNKEQLQELHIQSTDY